MLIRWTSVGRVIVAGAFAGLCLSAIAQTPKLKVRGTTQFIVGANLPWVNSAYGFDFGNNPLHPSWGIAYNSANVDSYFADMKNMNINVVRVWIMESLEGMTFDSNGNPNGLESTYLSNLDDMMTRANKYNLSIYFMVFNGDDVGTAWGQTLPSGAVIQNFLNSSSGITDVINNCIKPIASRYSGNSALFGFDLLNESNQGSDSGYYSWANMRAFGQQAATAIHSVASGAQVTMSTDWLQALDPANFAGSYGGLGFDLYDIHYYGDNPTLENTSSMAADKPVLLGEYGPTTKTDAGQNTDCSAILSQTAGYGYAGSLAWAYEYPGASDGFEMINSNGSWRPICDTIYDYVAALSTFSGSATVSPTSVNPGSAVTISASVTCNAARLSQGVYDLEIYNSSGTQVAQTYWTGIDYYKGGTTKETWKYTVPSNLPAGTYHVSIGIFGTNWTPLQFWVSSACTFTVK